MIFHLLWTVQSYYLLMVPRSINQLQLDVKLTTCNSNMIIITTLYIDRWSKTWLLNFNISKCHLLHLGLTDCYGGYYINGSVIIPTESVKDLVIIVDPSLKFHIHTSTVTARANRMLALINKSFEYLSTNMLLQLYKSFVHPILEYGNTV